MKKIQSILLAVVFSISLLGTGVLVIAEAGCSTSAQRTTFNSLYSVGHSVDAAYKSYLDLLIAGKISTNSVKDINKRYMDFQQAFSAAVSLSAIATNSPPTPEMSNAASQLLLAIQAAKGK